MEVCDLQMCECYYEVMSYILGSKVGSGQPCSYGNKCFLHNISDHPNSMETLYTLTNYNEAAMAINIVKRIRSSL